MVSVGDFATTLRVVIGGYRFVSGGSDTAAVICRGLYEVSSAGTSIAPVSNAATVSITNGAMSGATVKNYATLVVSAAAPTSDSFASSSASSTIENSLASAVS